MKPVFFRGTPGFILSAIFTAVICFCSPSRLFAEPRGECSNCHKMHNRENGAPRATFHKAHASDYPDMLRWDYGEMIAGAGGAGGCFICHTTKNWFVAL